MDFWLIGLQNIVAPLPLLLIAVGVAVGIVFGAIPGLSATMAVALCLPMTFGLEPAIAMAFLCGLFVGGISGGLISATLINIPGTPSSIATTFDGYPMTQRGEAGRALGIGIFYSFLGALFGWVFLAFLSPPLARFALRFGTFEYFSISVFALTLVAGLSGRSLAKGVASALIGMSVAMIGLAPIDAYSRFTFGNSALDGGLALLPVLLGLFAISEILKNAEEVGRAKAMTFPSFRISGFMGTSLSEFRSQLKNLLRSCSIGVGIGLLPGIGSGTSNLLAYLAAKNGSKYPEKFGTGVPDGIIASESSNNAGIGAAMVPLMTLGIPGDAVTAMLLGGFLIHGIQPGPLLFQINGDLVYSIFVALLIANFFMLSMEYYGMRLFVRLLKIPKHYLLSIVLVMCVVGAYGLNNRLFDVYTLFAFGALGYAMLKFGYPFAPLILGFILGPMIEENLRSALMSSRGDFTPFVTRPLSAIFLIAAAAYLAFALRKRKTSKQMSEIAGADTELE